jgi:ubiquitin-like 1-activating enzyme E1 A
VLGGTSVAILDPDMVTEEDLGANFFLRPQSCGKRRAEAVVEAVRELNPLVTVSVVHTAVGELSAAELNKYTVVCCCDLQLPAQVVLNDRCRAAGVAFFSACSLGLSAFLFCDLGAKHSFLVREATKEVNEEGDKVFQYVPKEVAFVTLREALGVPFAQAAAGSRERKRKAGGRSPAGFALEVLAAIHVLGAAPAGREQARTALRAALQGAEGGPSEDCVLELVEHAQAGAELAPVCAVMGGIVGQELIKCISGKDEPVNGFFFFDGLTGAGVVRTIKATHLELT